MRDGTLFHKTFTCPTAGNRQINTVVTGLNFIFDHSASGELSYWFRKTGTNPISVDIVACKLEIGEGQTLCHKENGVWVLNEVENTEPWQNTNQISAMQENGAYNISPVNIASQVIGGMTLTANADKTLTFAGSNTSGRTQVAYLTDYFTLPAGDYTVTTINAPSAFATDFQIYGTTTYLPGPGYATPTYSLSLNAETTIRWRMVFPNNANVNGKTIKPMIYDARLVNPPYQPGTMTNRELTDVTATLGVWEDITNQCLFPKETQAPHATDACQVYVNKLLKLISVELRFDVNTTALPDLGNQTAWMKLPSGYKWKLINDGEGTGSNYHFITIGLARVAASAEFTGQMDATKLSWRLSNLNNQSSLILSYGTSGTVKTSYLYTPMFMLPLETVPA
jgi:hypothetical protein